VSECPGEVAYSTQTNATQVDTERHELGMLRHRLGALRHGLGAFRHRPCRLLKTCL